MWRGGPSAEPQISAVCTVREGLLFLAMLAGASIRYDHMFRYAKQLVEHVAPATALTDTERQCFSSACTFFLQGKVKSYHSFVKAMPNLAGAVQWRANLVSNFLQVIASDLCKTCLDVVGIIDFYFLTPGCSPTDAATAEPRVFYNKMKGDILKYMMEVKTGVDRDNVVIDASRAYKAATDYEAVLPAAHPTRLDLKLSLALFYDEAYALPSVAYKIASEAVDMATREMEATGKTATELTALLLGSLRNAMELWEKGNEVAEFLNI